MTQAKARKKRPPKPWRDRKARRAWVRDALLRHASEDVVLVFFDIRQARRNWALYTSSRPHMKSSRDDWASCNRRTLNREIAARVEGELLHKELMAMLSAAPE